MFGIPGKQAVTLTPKAVAHIKKLMEGNGHAGLRLGVKKGGCACRHAEGRRTAGGGPA